MMAGAGHRDLGFALVLVVALLALLVLATYGLSVVGQTASRLAEADRDRMLARQNALLALAVARGQLQAAAGPDERVTAMAGLVGVPTQSSFRHWCGVWREGAAAPEAWLTSGAVAGGMPGLAGARVVLVGAGSVGNPTDRTEQERVEAGLIDLPGETAGAVAGHLAYWVGDEGVKVSAVVLAHELQISGTSGTGLRANLRRLVASSFAPDAAGNERILAFEQLGLPGTGISLTGSFHALTRSHRALPTTAGDGMVGPDGYVVGVFNVNTTSAEAWRALLEFPDQMAPAFGLSDAAARGAARRLRDLLAARGTPLASVDELIESGILPTALSTASPKVKSPTASEMLAEWRPILAVRSDTFRIRAYGDAINPATGARESVAYCEAIVQRTPEMIDGTLGRRFVITYFRWLYPDQI